MRLHHAAEYVVFSGAASLLAYQVGFLRSGICAFGCFAGYRWRVQQNKPSAPPPPAIAALAQMGLTQLLSCAVDAHPSRYLVSAQLLTLTVGMWLSSAERKPTENDLPLTLGTCALWLGLCHKYGVQSVAPYWTTIAFAHLAHGPNGDLGIALCGLSLASIGIIRGQQLWQWRAQTS